MVAILTLSSMKVQLYLIESDYIGSLCSSFCLEERLQLFKSVSLNTD